MTCHAVDCQHSALPGMPMCFAHWSMLPAKVREAGPWVSRPVDGLHISHGKAVDETGNMHRPVADAHARGRKVVLQGELFA